MKYHVFYGMYIISIFVAVAVTQTHAKVHASELTVSNSKKASEQENSAIFLVAALGKLSLVEAAMEGKLIKWVSGKAHIREKEKVRYDKKWRDQHAHRTSLHIAAFNGHYETCRLLVENGWDPSARDIRGQTPGEVAYEKEYYDIAKLLGNDALKNKITEKFEKYSAIDATNEHNNALFVAATRSDRNMVRQALFEGKEIEVNWDDNHQIGITAGSKRKVKYSPTWSKDGHPKDKMKGWTALHMAVFKNDLELIKDFIDAGWNRQQKNGQGNIPYELADNWETKSVLERHVKRDRTVKKKEQAGSSIKSNSNDETDNTSKNAIDIAPVDNTENNKRKENEIKGIKEPKPEVNEEDANEIAAYLKKRKEMEDLERLEDEEALLADNPMPEDL
jgi:ankyrin repeat protein